MVIDNKMVTWHMKGWLFRLGIFHLLDETFFEITEITDWEPSQKIEHTFRLLFHCLVCFNTYSADLGFFGAYFLHLMIQIIKLIKAVLKCQFNSFMYKSVQIYLLLCDKIIIV